MSVPLPFALEAASSDKAQEYECVDGKITQRQDLQHHDAS